VRCNLSRHGGETPDWIFWGFFNVLKFLLSTLGISDVQLTVFGRSGLHGNFVGA